VWFCPEFRGTFDGAEAAGFGLVGTAQDCKARCLLCTLPTESHGEWHDAAELDGLARRFEDMETLASEAEMFQLSVSSPFHAFRHLRRNGLPTMDYALLTPCDLFHITVGVWLWSLR
jgi:hypothetical protein